MVLIVVPLLPPSSVYRRRQFSHLDFFIQVLGSMGVCKGCGEEYVFLTGDYCGACKKRLAQSRDDADYPLTDERHKRRHSTSVGDSLFIQPDTPEFQNDGGDLEVVSTVTAKRVQRQPLTEASNLAVKVDDPRDKGRAEGPNLGKG